MLTAHHRKLKPISSLGRWWPNRSEIRQLGEAVRVSPAGVGVFVGLVPAAGGDIAGLIGWDRSRRASKTGDTYGKGNIEGVVAADTASSATLGGSLTTTMALGIPGDSVMAVMIGSMLIWGLQPGPRLFTEQPELLVSIAGIMLLATMLSLAASLARLRGMVKLLDTPNYLLWPVILIFCMVGTYATTNNLFTVFTMLGFGVIGLIFKRTGIPAGPVVLGLLLGPIAEENFSRALVLGQGQSFFSVWSPIALALLVFSLASLLWPILRRLSARTDARLSETIAEEISIAEEPTADDPGHPVGAGSSTDAPLHHEVRRAVSTPRSSPPSPRRSTRTVRWTPRGRGRSSSSWPAPGTRAPSSSVPPGSSLARPGRAGRARRPRRADAVAAHAGDRAHRGGQHVRGAATARARPAAPGRRRVGVITPTSCRPRTPPCGTSSPRCPPRPTGCGSTSTSTDVGRGTSSPPR